SRTQQGIWVHTNLQPEVEVAYHESFILRLNGHLDKELLADALADVVARHEMTRATGFDGETYQVTDDILAKINYLTLDAKEVDRLIENELSTKFDLKNGLAWRLSLIELGSDHSLLLFCAHHIA